MNLLRIGVDFDNTIVSYDGVFHRAAVERGLIPETIPTSKGAVRDYLRLTRQEDAWTELQGYVYGSRMDLARPYPGFGRFLALCLAKQIPVSIISHKTKYPYLGRSYDLHQSATTWLELQSFCYIPPTFFELTLQDKLKRIGLESCTAFIDDLPELLAEKAFPAGVQKILFDPHGASMSWDRIVELLHLSDA